MVLMIALPKEGRMYDCKDPLMAADPESPTTRAGRRAAAKSRREAKAAYRDALFDALAAGWTHRQIAEERNVSVRTVRRDIDRAIADKRPDAPQNFVRLQVARLMKALRLADAGLERGELRAVGPLLKVVAALDRYHGLIDPKRAARRARQAVPDQSAPPLAPSQEAQPLDDLAEDEREVESVTDFHT